MGAVSKYIRIEAPPKLVYDLWRDPTAFPEFMPDVNKVEDHGEHWHWEVAGPLGRAVKFQTTVVEDVPGEKLAWKSVDGNVQNSGVVRFDPREDGEATDMEYSIEFSPPGGTAGDVVAKIFDDPENKVQRALEAFKHVVEKDATPRSDPRTRVDPGEAAVPHVAERGEPQAERETPATPTHP
jgi:uncharacterized membrane protein